MNTMEHHSSSASDSQRIISSSVETYFPLANQFVPETRTTREPPVPAFESFPYYSRHHSCDQISNKDIPIFQQDSTNTSSKEENIYMTTTKQIVTCLGSCYSIRFPSSRDVAAQCIPLDLLHFDNESTSSGCIHSPKPVKLKLCVQPVEKPAEHIEAIKVFKPREVRVSLMSSLDTPEQISLKLLYNTLPETEPEPENIQMSPDLMPLPVVPEEVVEVKLFPIGDSKMAHMQEHCNTGFKFSSIVVRMLGIGTCLGLEMAQQFLIYSLESLNKSLQVYCPIASHAMVSTFKSWRKSYKLLLQRSILVANHVKQVALACIKRTGVECAQRVKQQTKTCISCFVYEEDSQDEIGDLPIIQRRNDRPTYYDVDLAWKESLRSYPEPIEELELRSNLIRNGIQNNFHENQSMTPMADCPLDKPTPDLSIFEGYPFYTKHCQLDSYLQDHQHTPRLTKKTLKDKNVVIPFRARHDYDHDVISCPKNRSLPSRYTNKKLPIYSRGLDMLMWSSPAEMHNFANPSTQLSSPPRRRDLLQKIPFQIEGIWRDSLRVYPKHERPKIRPEDVLLYGKAIIPLKKESNHDEAPKVEEEDFMSKRCGKLPSLEGYPYYSKNLLHLPQSKPALGLDLSTKKGLVKHLVQNFENNREQDFRKSPKQKSIDVSPLQSKNESSIQRSLHTPRHGKKDLEVSISSHQKITRSENHGGIFQSNRETLPSKDDAPSPKPLPASMLDQSFWQQNPIHTSKSSWKASALPHSSTSSQLEKEDIVQQHPMTRVFDPTHSLNAVESSFQPHSHGTRHNFEVMSIPIPDTQVKKTKFSKRPLRLAKHQLSSHRSKIASSAESGKLGRSLKTYSSCANPNKFKRLQTKQVKPQVKGFSHLIKDLQSSRKSLFHGATTPLSNPYDKRLLHCLPSIPPKKSKDENNSRLKFYDIYPRSKQKRSIITKGLSKLLPKKSSNDQVGQGKLMIPPQMQHGNLCQPASTYGLACMQLLTTMTSSITRCKSMSSLSKQNLRFFPLKNGSSFSRPASISSYPRVRRPLQKGVKVKHLGRSSLWNIFQEGKSKFSIYRSCQLPTKPNSKESSPRETSKSTTNHGFLCEMTSLKLPEKEKTQLLSTLLSSICIQSQSCKRFPIKSNLAQAKFYAKNYCGPFHSEFSFVDHQSARPAKLDQNYNIAKLENSSSSTNEDLRISKSLTTSIQDDPKIVQKKIQMQTQFQAKENAEVSVKEKRKISLSPTLQLLGPRNKLKKNVENGSASQALSSQVRDGDHQTFGYTRFGVNFGLKKPYNKSIGNFITSQKTNNSFKQSDDLCLKSLPLEPRQVSRPRATHSPIDDGAFTLNPKMYEQGFLQNNSWQTTKPIFKQRSATNLVVKKNHSKDSKSSFHAAEKMRQSIQSISPKTTNARKNSQINMLSKNSRSKWTSKSRAQNVMILQKFEKQSLSERKWSSKVKETPTFPTYDAQVLNAMGKETTILPTSPPPKEKGESSRISTHQANNHHAQVLNTKEKLVITLPTGLNESALDIQNTNTLSSTIEKPTNSELPATSNLLIDTIAQFSRDQFFSSLDFDGDDTNDTITTSLRDVDKTLLLKRRSSMSHLEKDHDHDQEHISQSPRHPRHFSESHNFNNAHVSLAKEDGARSHDSYFYEQKNLQPYSKRKLEDGNEHAQSSSIEPLELCSLVASPNNDNLGHQENEANYSLVSSEPLRENPNSDKTIFAKTLESKNEGELHHHQDHHKWQSNTSHSKQEKSLTHKILQTNLQLKSDACSVQPDLNRKLRRSTINDQNFSKPNLNRKLRRSTVIDQNFSKLHFSDKLAAWESFSRAKHPNIASKQSKSILESSDLLDLDQAPKSFIKKEYVVEHPHDHETMENGRKVLLSTTQNLIQKMDDKTNSSPISTTLQLNPHLDTFNASKSGSKNLEPPSFGKDASLNNIVVSSNSKSLHLEEDSDSTIFNNLALEEGIFLELNPFSKDKHLDNESAPSSNSVSLPSIQLSPLHTHVVSITLEFPPPQDLKESTHETMQVESIESHLEECQTISQGQSRTSFLLDDQTVFDSSRKGPSSFTSSLTTTSESTMESVLSDVNEKNPSISQQYNNKVHDVLQNLKPNEDSSQTKSTNLDHDQTQLLANLEATSSQQDEGQSKVRGSFLEAKAKEEIDFTMPGTYSPQNSLVRTLATNQDLYLSSVQIHHQILDKQELHIEPSTHEVLNLKGKGTKSLHSSQVGEIGKGQKENEMVSLELKGKGTKSVPPLSRKLSIVLPSLTDQTLVTNSMIDQTLFQLQSENIEQVKEMKHLETQESITHLNTHITVETNEGQSKFDKSSFQSKPIETSVVPVVEEPSTQVSIIPQNAFVPLEDKKGQSKLVELSSKDGQESQDNDDKKPKTSYTRKSTIFVRPTLKNSLITSQDFALVQVENIDAQNDASPMETTLIVEEENEPKQESTPILSREEEEEEETTKFLVASSRNSQFVSPMTPILERSPTRNSVNDESDESVAQLQLNNFDNKEMKDFDNQEYDITKNQSKLLKPFPSGGQDKNVERPMPSHSKRSTIFVRPTLKKSLVNDQDFSLLQVENFDAQKDVSGIEFPLVLGKDQKEVKSERKSPSIPSREENDISKFSGPTSRSSLFVRPNLKRSLVRNFISDDNLKFAQLQLNNFEEKGLEDPDSQDSQGLNIPTNAFVALDTNEDQSKLVKLSLRDGQDTNVENPMPISDESFTQLQLHNFEEKGSEDLDNQDFQGLNFLTNALVALESNEDQSKLVKFPLTDGQDANVENPMPSPSRKSTIFVRPTLKKSLVTDEDFTLLQAEKFNIQGLVTPIEVLPSPEKGKGRSELEGSLEGSTSTLRE